MMENLLVISSSEKSSDALSDIIREFDSVHIDNVKNCGEARRKIIESVYDVVIINTPLSDENGVELSTDISNLNDTGVLLLARAENADYIQSQVEDYGVFVVSKPINKNILYQALKFIIVAQKRALKFKKKEVKLRKQIDDIKVIDRAKCCLIEYLKMTESQSHRYIEKQAMDMRITKRLVAEDILKTYEM